MPFNFRKELAGLDKRVIDDVVALYEKADKLLQERMRKALSSKLTQARVNADITFMEKLMKKTISETKGKIELGVQESYTLGAMHVDVSLDKEDLVTFEKLSPAQKQQVAALAQESYLSFGQTLQVVSNTARSTLTKALRLQIREKVTTGILLGDSVEQIAKDLRDNVFTPKGITAFVKRNGARMSLPDYSRTVARSMIIGSANEGTMARMGENGLTVFQVSSHSGGAEDEACADHQGKIYDFTGKKYPKPQDGDLPPYHPNCRHIMQPRPDLQYSV